MEVEQLTNVDELWKQYFSTHDMEVKNRIVFHYLYIVNSVVKRMMPQYRHNERDELVSCGVLGLIDAVDKYDRSYGIKFQTYAAVRIRGEIIDYMRRQDWAPSSLRKKITDIQEASKALESAHNRQPTDGEIAAYLGVKTASVQKVRQKTRMFNLVYFEALPYEKEMEECYGSDKNDPCQIVENELMTGILREMINALPERKKTVIVLHYYEGLTMKSIAKRLRISESRVSQIHSRILLDMKMCLQA